MSDHAKPMYPECVEFSEYDAANNRTLVQDSFGATTTRTYDVLNRVTTMQFGGTGQTPLREDFTYTPRDQVAAQTRYSDLAGTSEIGSSTFTYDSVGRLTNLQHLNGAGSNLANYTNTYDVASRITAETLNGGLPTSYSYDAIDELTNDSQVTYTYDLNGNRTMTGYATGPVNELISDSTWNYFYDKNGNQIGKHNPSTGEVFSYGYDNRNRLVSAQDTTTSGVQLQATYVYDALGQRIEKDVWTQSGGSTTTRFAYDGGQIWADLTSTDTLQTRYVRGDRVLELLARIVNGTAEWILADRMGSVRTVVDNTGAVIDTINYDGYGNVVSETSPANGGQYKYDGYRYDSETGLYRPDPSTGRCYNPLAGIWIGRDPILFIAQEVNLYRGCDRRFGRPYAAVVTFPGADDRFFAGCGNSGIRSNSHSNSGWGFDPKKRSAAVVPSARSTTKLCTAVKACRRSSRNGPCP